MLESKCIKILFWALILIGNNSYSQIKTKPYTKLYFEEGFKNCIVTVIKNNNSLFKGVLTSASMGPAEIVEIKKPTNSKIIIKACGKIKNLFIKKNKFYRISIIDNIIIIKEVDEEPLYV